MTAHTSAPADPLPVNIEAEQALLGACLINNDAIAMVSSFLESRHFSEGLHARIYETMCELAGKGVRGSVVTLKCYLEDIELPSGVTIQAYLARLAAEATTVIDAPDYAAMIVDMWRRRELIRVTQDVAAAARTPIVNLSTGDLLDELEVQTAELRNSAPAETERSTIAGGVEELLIDIDTVRSGEAPPIATSGFLDIDRRLGGGLRPGRLIVLAGRPGMGKAQPIDSPVLAPTGWKRIGQLKIGDPVCHPRKGSTRVVGIYPQGRKETFLVTFHDGRQTLCCADHLWEVKDRHWPESRIMALKDIMKRKELFRLSIPLEAAEFGDQWWSPISPYVVGAMLGDGGFCARRAPVISSADQHIIERVSAGLPAPAILKKQEGYDYYLQEGLGSGAKHSPLKAAFARLGLGDDSKSDNKFVPSEILCGNFETRMQALRGLLDTDGTVEPSKTIRFTSCSERLAQDVEYLARSVGAWAKMRQRRAPAYSHNGQKRTGRDCWTVTIRHKDPHSLFSLPRKIERLGDGGQYAKGLRLAFKSIEPAPETECVCIRVEEDDGLYFTDDFIITHNTVLMCALARRAARKGFGVDIYSLEIDRKELTARMLANALGATAFPLDYRDILSGRVDDSDIPRLAQLRDKFAEIPLSIDATPALRISQIESRAKRTALRLARGGKKLDVVFIDYLGLVSVGDRYKGNKVAELGDIALGAKNMAKRLGCAVVLLSQLNRSVESRDDKRPLLSDLRESGNIEEHTDAVGFLYRPAYYDDQDPRKERDAEFADSALRRANDLEIIWRKNRLGPTGTDKLYCRVERSFVDNGERYR